MTPGVEAIRDEEQDLFVVFGPLHLFSDRKLNSIVSRRLTRSFDVPEGTLDFLHVRREMMTNIDIGIEGNNKHFILGRKRLRNLSHGLQSLLQLVPHAAAGVD